MADFIARGANRHPTQSGHGVDQLHTPATVLQGQQARQADVVPTKQLAPAVEAAQQKLQANIPAPNQPWRRYGQRPAQAEPADRAAPADQPPPALGG